MDRVQHDEQTNEAEAQVDLIRIRKARHDIFIRKLNQPNRELYALLHQSAA
jgi:hypothetical protein